MESKQAPENSHPVFCVGGNIRRANRMVSQFFDDALRPSGLRITQFSLLMLVGDLGAITINRLAESALTDRTTLTRNLRPLEKQGLIRITPARDRRMREIRITTKGRHALKRAFPYWEQAQAHMRGGLGEPRFKRLLGDLKETIRLAQT